MFSDWHDGLSLQLKELGLREHFQYFITSAELGFAKAQEQAYIEMAKHLAIDPHESIFVGDSYELDYKPSEQAGFLPILINRNNQVLDANVNSVPDLWHLVSLLETPGSIFYQAGEEEMPILN